VRIAIISDIHGNLTAFEAVRNDLKQTAPDLVFHGGDLADSGSSPREIVDLIRDLNWPGVYGNTDEMLFRPDSLAEFARSSPHMQSLFRKIDEMAAFSRETLGDERLAWLRGLPQQQLYGSLTLVHASPATVWRAPAANATEEELATAYGCGTTATVVYGHVHQPFVRSCAGRTIANSGSVGLPYDGDPRASYLLLDNTAATVRRVSYDVDCEIELMRASGLPYPEWTARMLRSARFEMP
jgi:predicted phosphodiesterase